MGIPTVTEHCTVPIVNENSFLVASLTHKCTRMLRQTKRLPCVVGSIGRLSVRAAFQTALAVLWEAIVGAFRENVLGPLSFCFPLMVISST